MTPTDLQNAGQALYGRQWQTELARVLNVLPVRVRDWQAGRRPIPEWIWGKIADELIARSEAQKKIAHKIKQDVDTAS